jgi:dTDP-glucose 4,6-dehydratase
MRVWSGGIMSGTALITGGAGFLGSYLCDRFLGAGYRVICMDNLITGSVSNISRLESNPNFTFIKHDVSKYIEIKEPIDYVLHFASPASPIDYLKYPIQTLKVGSLGTHNALGVAKEKRASFLLASTSEIYGDPKIHPQPETYYGHVNCIGPRGVYDEAKRFAEAITMAYHKTHGLNTHIVRIFNTYGPRMRKQDGRAIPNFISQALKNEPITVYGKGDQTRSFCYATDLIEGIFLLSQSDIHDPVNIGNPVELKIIDMAKKIIKMTGSKSKIVHDPLPQDDPKVRQPDITRAKKLLNWKPKIDLEQGLQETIKWFLDSR